MDKTFHAESLNIQLKMDTKYPTNKISLFCQKLAMEKGRIFDASLDKKAQKQSFLQSITFIFNKLFVIITKDK